MMGSPHISEPDKIVEIADQRAPLARRPQHPYTEAPWSAMPVPDPEAAQQRIILKGATMNIPDTSYEAGISRLERELADASAPLVRADHLCFVTIRGEKTAGIS